MQEKLGKIFLSEDLKSIKIKIYISLVLSILTKLYFKLIFPFGSLNGNIFKDLFYNFFLIYSVFSCILIIFALYGFSKLSYTHLLRNYIILRFFITFCIIKSFLRAIKSFFGIILLVILAIFELAFIVFYPIWLLLELIAWVKFKEFKRQF